MIWTVGHHFGFVLLAALAARARGGWGVVRGGKGSAMEFQHSKAIRDQNLTNQLHCRKIKGSIKPVTTMKVPR